MTSHEPVAPNMALAPASNDHSPDRSPDHYYPDRDPKNRAAIKAARHLSAVPAAPETDRGTVTLFNGARWREAVEASFDVTIRCFTPTSDPDGHAYYSLVSDIRGDRVVCTPFSDVCDPILSAAGWREFAAHLRSFELPTTIRPFTNPAAVADDSFEVRRELLWHGIDLTGGAEAIWDGLKTKLRTSIRRADKSGISLRWSTEPADVEVFHRMHVNLRKSKYRLLAQPLSFFMNLKDGFGDDMALLIAEQHGSPLAAMIFFVSEDVCYYKFSASYPAKYRPNAAMIMEACRQGADRGVNLLDMGRSDIEQTGLVQFKQQFGSIERPLTTLHYSPANGADNHRGAAVSQTLGDMTQLLTDPTVPDEVTAEAGRLLYRYFS